MRQLHWLLVSFILLSIPSTAQTPRTPWTREPGEISRTLDSLASVSIGSYVHFAVGSCVGGRCEELVSIHRDSEDDVYRYRGAAWVGIPLKSQFYGTRRELPEEEAGAILADARLAGIMSLVADSTTATRSQPRFWLRARFGDQIISIDGASLASPSYAASIAGGPGDIYDRVEKALLAPLHDQFRRRTAE